jgi:adenine-specific DNA methylase
MSIRRFHQPQDRFRLFAVKPMVRDDEEGPWVTYREHEEEVQRRENEPTLRQALQRVKEAAEHDGSGVIYLHAGPEEPIFGVFMAVGATAPEGLKEPAMATALDALEHEGWNPYDHSHIDGDD